MQMCGSVVPTSLGTAAPITSPAFCATVLATISTSTIVSPSHSGASTITATTIPASIPTALIPTTVIPTSVATAFGASSHSTTDEASATIHATRVAASFASKSVNWAVLNVESVHIRQFLQL